MNRYLILAAVVILVIALVLVGRTRPGKPHLVGSNPPAQKSTIDPSKILDGGPGKDGIPSIDKPKFTSIPEAGSWLKDKDLVMLVTLNNQTKAYPILIMNWHEIVNDRIGNTPILVSYCPLCGSGIVYRRVSDGEEVEFGVSGKLYNSDLLMYDRKTNTLWSQISGEAVLGQLAGKKLEQLEANLIDFKTLKDKYPQAQVLSRDTGFARDYSRSPYGDYDSSSQVYFPVEHTSDKVFPKDRVIGIEVDGKFKAYRFDTLKQKKTLTDMLDNKEIRLTLDNSEMILVNDLTDKTEINFINTYWFAWVAFHPETEIYK